MNELTIISGKVHLDTTYLKIKISLEEIKEKHGQRKDLIDSMERSLLDLQEVKIAYDAMEKELRVSLQQNFRLEKLLQEEKFKNKDLQTQLNMKDATL
jgi:fructose-1,6-bisphosphatase/inositol monophosphatase family enzyme